MKARITREEIGRVYALEKRAFSDERTIAVGAAADVSCRVVSGEMGCNARDSVTSGARASAPFSLSLSPSFTLRARPAR